MIEKLTLIWTAKEALYKALNQKGLFFLTTPSAPFQWGDRKGSAKVFFKEKALIFLLILSLKKYTVPAWPLQKIKNMNISVELTLSHSTMILKSNKNFIQKLRILGFKVLENPMSTQIYGEYDALMSALQQAIKEGFENESAVVLNMKIIKGDRSGYVPVFDFLFGQYSGYATIDIVLEITGVLFGLLSVWYAKKNNIWVYPTGMISTSIFVYLLFKWALLGDMIINAYYFIMSAYGWYYW